VSSSSYCTVHLLWKGQNSTSRCTVKRSEPAVSNPSPHLIRHRESCSRVLLKSAAEVIGIDLGIPL
jgi:hypothetical protein